MNLLKTLFGAGSASTSLNAADAKARIENGEPLLILDVRTPDEFRVGHISGAKLIPLNELSQRMNELPKDQDILCVCRSGSRSSAAVGQLTRSGYSAINLRGGMIGWQASRFPVKKGK
ncbi:MAG: rhodanese-like domain-containing protein [Anaerolineae bacterium]|nr:rhodanese-like domain-containing protein [Anaerolineae bacterium]